MPMTRYTPRLLPAQPLPARAARASPPGVRASQRRWRPASEGAARRCSVSQLRRRRRRMGLWRTGSGRGGETLCTGSRAPDASHWRSHKRRQRRLRLTQRARQRTAAGDRPAGGCRAAPQRRTVRFGSLLADGEEPALQLPLRGSGGGRPGGPGQRGRQNPTYGDLLVCWLIEYVNSMNVPNKPRVIQLTPTCETASTREPVQ